MISLSPELLTLLAPALLAGVIVASTHVPLGQEVLRRGIIFIDLAVAQIAALGALAAHVLFQVDGTILSMVSALIFALAAGALFACLEKRAPDHLEALIGSSFVIAASLGILLLAHDPHGNEHMQDMLAGQILWVDTSQLILTAAIYGGILALWFGRKDKQDKLFYVVFPVTITLSVQLVGVYLVFASLIMPALGTVTLTGLRRLFAGYTIALLTFALGLLISTVYDLPSGPAIVCMYPVCALLITVVLHRKSN